MKSHLSRNQWSEKSGQVTCLPRRPFVAGRSQFGVVLQSSQLMPGDIYTNIVGTHALTVDDAWDAARLCGLDSDIEAMPMGMHTVIGEGASTLSEGQRQRILIARAIVRRPRIILFDEATSALDNQTQMIVARSLERLKATRIGSSCSRRDVSCSPGPTPSWSTSRAYSLTLLVASWHEWIAGSQRDFARELREMAPGGPRHTGAGCCATNQS